MTQEPSQQPLLSDAAGKTPDQEEEEIRYNDALGELEAILGGIESEDIDLDELGVKVERAAWLIRVCRARIHKTELRIQQVLTELTQDEGGKA